jgi:hypothetical protein
MAMIEVWAVGVVVLVVCFGATLGGSLLRGVLPRTELTSQTRGVVKLVIGLVGTLSALVLGLMISSAKNSYDKQREEIIRMASKVVTLDRTLALYGPETKALRKEFRDIVVAAKERMWPSEWAKAGTVEPARAGETWFHHLHQLTPASKDQEYYFGRAIELSSALIQGQWLLYHLSASTVSVPFLAVITFWFAVIFAGLGVLAPRSATVLVMMFICSSSVAGAVVLAFELDNPYAGIIRMTTQPIEKAVNQLGRD